MYSDNLSKKLILAVQPLVKFRQFCDFKDAAFGGKGKGATFHWNVYEDISTQGTTLIETNTMPESQYTITQGTLTIDEFGNSVPYSGKLDDLSEHDVTEVINKILKNDATKAFDIAAHGQFDATPLRVYPTGGTATDAVTLSTTGTVGGTASVALGKGHIEAIVVLMKERNIPPYSKDDYFAISWPGTFSNMKSELESVFQYTTEGFGRIVNGEIGRYNNCRFVEQMNIEKDDTTYTDWVYFFGEDTVAEAVAVPEEIRGKIPGDYGRSRGVAWYYLGGFGLVHTAHAQARIVKWESLA